MGVSASVLPYWQSFPEHKSFLTLSIELQWRPYRVQSFWLEAVMPAATVERFSIDLFKTAIEYGDRCQLTQTKLGASEQQLVNIFAMHLLAFDIEKAPCFMHLALNQKCSSDTNISVLQKKHTGVSSTYKVKTDRKQIASSHLGIRPILCWDSGKIRQCSHLSTSFGLFGHSYHFALWDLHC